MTGSPGTGSRSARAAAEGSPAAGSPAPRSVGLAWLGGPGLLASCGPLSLLGASFVLMIGGLLLTDVRQVLVGVTAELLVLPLLVGRSGFPLLRLVPPLLAVTSVIWSNWLLAAGRSVETAAVAGLRVAFFVLPGVVFASYLDPSRVGDHLAQRLRLPDRPVVALTAALQRVERLTQEWEIISRARRVRGLAPGPGVRNWPARVRHLAGMSFALLVSALRQASRMAIAMDARGYSAARARGTRRTWLVPARWTRADTLLMLCSLALSGLPHVAGR